MKTLVTTAQALRELSTGTATSSITESASLGRFEYPDVDLLLHRDDDLNSVPILLMGCSSRTFLPKQLERDARRAYSRIASFAERAQSSTGSLNLPHSWSQFKDGSFITFYALPGADADAARWIAEVPETGTNLILWTLTDRKNQVDLHEFRTQHRDQIYPFHQNFLDAIEALPEKWRDEIDQDIVPPEISLAPLETRQSDAWTVDEWLAKITPEQSQFVNSPENRPIRLKGAAGSGKTVALALKALKHAQQARKTNASTKILITTHSWALADQIDNFITTIDSSARNHIDVFPLMEIAKTISPQYVNDDLGFRLLGDDSLSGKRATLDIIREVIEEFIATDWITYSSSTSSSLRERINSNQFETIDALTWDLMLEFGSVIGAGAIFPGAGSLLKYRQIKRAPWMLPLDSEGDTATVFRLYEMYMTSLKDRKFLTGDQVLADLLSHLETHAWNRTRIRDGYDLILVDEYHLFSPLERHVLHFLSRDVRDYPHIFMALDPGQSASAEFIGNAADEVESGSDEGDTASTHSVQDISLTGVHRYTPEILALIQHLFRTFPTFELGADWAVDLSAVESLKDHGSLPILCDAASKAGNAQDMIQQIQSNYSNGRIAVAVIDPNKWAYFSALATDIAKAGRFHIDLLSARQSVSTLAYRQRGVVFAPASELAGLQFDTVLIAGLPNMDEIRNINERIRILSLLYLAVSRSQRKCVIFVNDDDGGIPKVLKDAIDTNTLDFISGDRTLT